jgi:hypothetical protein
MTPDDLKVSLLTNANFIFALNGKPMQTATPQTVKNIMISTPGAALALKADMEYRLVNYNEGKKMAVASARYIFDKSYIKTKMLAMMKTTMESMKAFGGDVPKDEDLKKMVEEEVEKDPWNLTRTYVFNLNTGMPSLISEKFVSKDKEGKEVVTILKTRITVSK